MAESEQAPSHITGQSLGQFLETFPAQAGAQETSPEQPVPIESAQ